MGEVFSLKKKQLSLAMASTSEAHATVGVNDEDNDHKVTATDPSGTRGCVEVVILFRQVRTL
jgi:hypothetical protein